MESRLIVNKTSVVSKKGIVTAMHPLAAKVGANILNEGGNAADAAVATAFAVGVVEPFMSGLGGGASILIHQANKGRTRVIDGSVVVPSMATDNMFELLDDGVKGSGIYGWRGTKNDEAETGYKSVAIPGAVKAYTRLLDRFGSMSLKQVIEPAIDIATNGFPVDWYVFFTCATSLPRLRQFPDSMATFYGHDGLPLLAGNYDDTRGADLLIQPNLAQTLTIIAERGEKGFYEGQVARSITEYIQGNGGILSEHDLASYEVREFDPLEIEYRNRLINFAPFNSGGTTVAEILNILESFNLSSLGHNTAESIHLIAEATRMGFSDRFAHMGDPMFSNIPISGLESKAYARARSKVIDKNKVSSDLVGDPWSYQPESGTSRQVLPGGYDALGQNTTHLNVVDSNRNMVALNSSLGQAFGSGVVVPDTGVTLNNGLMWFDPEPGHINSLRPGKYAMHAGTPTLIFDDRGPVMALGAPGGRKVLTSVLQSIINTVDYGLGIQEALSAPRIHSETGTLSVDDRLPSDVVCALRKKGHNVVLREETYISSYFGRPSAVFIDREKNLLRSGLEPYKLSTAVGI